MFTFSGEPLAWAIIAYGLAASVVPVWLLLAPRDYLSTFMKLGTISLLAGNVHREAEAFARELGYERAVTYTLASEPGASLRASGFAKEADVPEQDWNRPGRRRKVYEVNLFDTERKTPLGAKVRWGRKL